MLDVPLMRAASSGSAAGTAAPRMAGMMAARTKNFMLAIVVGFRGYRVDGIAFESVLHFLPQHAATFHFLIYLSLSPLSSTQSQWSGDATVIASSLHIFQATKTKLLLKPQYTLYELSVNEDSELYK